MSIQPDDISTLQRLFAINGYRELHAVINGLDVQIQWSESAGLPPMNSSPGPETAPAPPQVVPLQHHYLRSPTVGRPEPDMFQVVPGDRVTVGQIVVVLNQGETRVAIRSDVAGRVTAVRDYSDTGLVQHDHWLLVIEPDPEPIA